MLGIGQGGALGLGLILPVLRGGGAASVAALTAMSLCVGYIVAAAGRGCWAPCTTRRRLDAWR